MTFMSRTTACRPEEGLHTHERKTKINTDIMGETPSATATTNLFPVFTTVCVKVK